MFQLFMSHHQAEELMDFYKRVLHMKWLSSLQESIWLYIISLAKRYMLKAKLLISLKLN
jgi:hypothetical protein